MRNCNSILREVLTGRFLTSCLCQFATNNGNIVKRINILLVIVVCCLVASCSETYNSQQEENKEAKANETQAPGIRKNNGSYELDSSVILSNQNLPHLILELEKANLESKQTYQEAPEIVISLLDSLTDGFDIANPGEDWQVGCVRMGKMIEKKVNDSIVEVTFIDAELPSRELIYLGTSNNITLMTYYTGGIGKTAHTLIIKHDDLEVMDLWKGSAPYNINTKRGIIDYLKENRIKKWGLNYDSFFM